MKKNYIVPVIFLIAISVLFFLKGGIVDLNSSSDFVLLITFIALFWYSYETMKIRISSEEQIDLLTKPVVELVMEQKGNTASYCFKVKNVGAGLASNIEVEILANGLSCRNNLYPEGSHEEMPEFIIPNYLYPGQEGILAPKQIEEEKYWVIKKAGEIKIKYKNLKEKEFVNIYKVIERCKNSHGWIYYQIKKL